MFAVSLALLLSGTGECGQSITPPQVKTSSAPEYPIRARGEGVAGTARFRAQIDENGRVRDVEILKVPAEHFGFERAVEEAVEKWTFEPARADETPIVGTYEGDMRFTLHADEEEAIYRLISDSNVNRTQLHQKRIRVRGEWAGQNSIWHRWLAENSAPEDLENQVVLIDSFYFATPLRSAGVFATISRPGDREEAVVLRALKRSSGWFLVWVGPKWDSEPVAVYTPPEPEYPSRAERTRMSGNVRVLIAVTVEGQTEILEVLTPLPDGLTETAREHVEQWRWEPALRDGVPVEAVGEMTVSFRVRD